MLAPNDIRTARLLLRPWRAEDAASLLPVLEANRSHLGPWIPARVAAGLAYLDGKFYYHAWPEVFLERWVAVDPTFGQFPADASHLRFTIGGLGRQVELLRLIGALQIDVLSAR